MVQAHDQALHCHVSHFYLASYYFCRKERLSGNILPPEKTYEKHYVLADNPENVLADQFSVLIKSLKIEFKGEKK